MENSEKTIGQIVADDYRTAKIFESHGIDFCCGGQATLGETCKEKKIDLDLISGEIEAAKKEPLDRAFDYASWELPFLADYIVNIHHSYLKEHTSQLMAYAWKISAVHGEHHPEVKEISRVFDRMAADLGVHMRKEEEEFFPLIRRAAEVSKAGRKVDARDRDAIRDSVQTFSREHAEIGEAMDSIRQLARNYAIPSDVCNTFVITYRKFQEFEADLHKHVHLENNLLFAKAALL